VKDSKISCLFRGASLYTQEISDRFGRSIHLNQGKNVASTAWVDPALEAAGEIEDTQHAKYLTFCLGTEDYGIEIKNVTEIIGIQKITEIPEMAAHSKGVINLRGKIIPVMDLRLRFQLPAREYDERTCIVVVHVQDTSVGLIVDTVNEVSVIPDDQIELSTGLASNQRSGFIRGIGKAGEAIKIILDIQALLFGKDMQNRSTNEVKP
jgi:purine-binding chemotaxis protein CheW